MDFTVLQTERLILRALQMEDADAVFSLRSNPEVNKYIGRPEAQNKNEGKQFVEKIQQSITNNAVFYWVISLKESHDLIGSICLWNFNNNKTVAETGYELLPEFHGKGIMTEALKCVLDFAFTRLNIQTIEAFTHKDNLSSTRLLVGQGFVLDEQRKDDEVEHNQIFTITNPNIK
ncbi:GNAT family N-acetyltransferase [Pontimicrobium sp. IMCC45349]|uniref:GNAT family N-acetyltransferase n=1 Tax=Pontimicrobium sp. IMCC45349 TaxID=3391574 RepID=UPI0039A3059E